MMTGDHVNKYLCGEAYRTLFNAGRIAMPLFVTVFAYHLSKHKVTARLLVRLLVAGVLASPAFMALNKLLGGWWPLNIMFLFFCLAAITALNEQKRYLSAVLVGILGGAIVEFFWPALYYGVAATRYFKRPSCLTAIVAVALLAVCRIVNGCSWALMALPIIVGPSLLAKRYPISIPRAKWFYYAYYPAHLSMIWAIQAIQKFS